MLSSSDLSAVESIARDLQHLTATRPMGVGEVVPQLHRLLRSHVTIAYTLKMEDGHYALQRGVFTSEEGPGYERALRDTFDAFARSRPVFGQYNPMRPE